MKTLREELHGLLLDHYNGKITFLEALETAYGRGRLDGQDELLDEEAE